MLTVPQGHIKQIFVLYRAESIISFLDGGTLCHKLPCPQEVAWPIYLEKAEEGSKPN